MLSILNSKCFKFFLSLFVVFCTMGCEKINMDELEPVSDSRNINDVVFKFRSTSGVEIGYPLHVFVLNNNTDKIVQHKVIEDEQNNFSIALNSGSYYIAAIANVGNCDLTKLIQNNGRIIVPSSGILSQALQIGGADVDLKKDVSVQITLSHAVAALSITLTDIPQDVENVSVNLSAFPTELDITGTAWNPEACSVTLKKDNEQWKSDLFYTLPSTTENLTFTINTTSPQGQNVYGYKYNGRISANTPYEFYGSFEKGFSVEGEVNLRGWNETQKVNFSFGSSFSSSEDLDDESNDKPDDSPVDIQDEIEEFDVLAKPNVGDVWEGRIVAAYGEEDENSLQVLLLSAKDWQNVCSAESMEFPTMAQDTCNAYVDNGLTNWHIPTASEAKMIINNLGKGQLTSVNANLKANGLPILDDSEGVRYLCENAEKTFKWSAISVIKSGAERTYNLRLVNWVKLNIKDN